MNAYLEEKLIKNDLFTYHSYMFSSHRIYLVKNLIKHPVYNNQYIGFDLKYDVDWVIHLAGLSGVRDSLKNPTEYWTQNVIASQRVFDHFKDTKILYASSSTAKEPARNPYGMTKHLMERIAPQTSTGLRFCTIYSNSQQRPNMFVPRLLRKEIQYIHTNHKRDFIHIDDDYSIYDLEDTQQVSE